MASGGAFSSWFWFPSVASGITFDKVTVVPPKDRHVYID